MASNQNTRARLRGGSKSTAKCPLPRIEPEISAAQFRANRIQALRNLFDEFVEQASGAELFLMNEVLLNWDSSGKGDDFLTLVSAFQHSVDAHGWHDYVKVPEKHANTVLKFVETLDAPPTPFKPQENGWRLWTGEKKHQVTN